MRSGILIGQWLVLTFVLWGACASRPVAGQLTAERVVVVAAANNPDSREVAEAYCQFRSFPTDRILEVEFPAGVTLSRSAWEDQIRGQLSTRIQGLDPENKVTDVVLVYGTPLAVAAWEDDRELKQWEAYYQKSMDDGVRRLNLALKTLGELSGQEPAAVQLPINLADLRQVFQQQIEAAQKGVAAKPAADQPAASAQLQNQVQAVAGLFPFMNSLQQQLQNAEGDALANMQQQLQYLRGRSEILTQTIQYLERMPATFEREATMIALLEQGGGLLDVLTWLQRQMDLVQMNDSMASLDSELGLLFWGEYRRIGIVPNFLNPAFDGSPLRNAFRTLRVSRIDGPTAAVAKQLIDRTREAEALTEIKGNAYLDLRGIQSGDPLLVQTENWLKAVSEQLKTIGGLNVQVESTAKLYQSGECPDALVYLGWYSLGKYIDCCKFKPGAIAYHLVPGDALRLRDGEQQGWCRSFLEAGATRVIGSVGEAVPVLLTVDATAKQSPMAINIVTAELSDGMIIFAVP
ncbi:MAG: TIGR03790 family protein [Planctomycetaceae bacterium]|nr:TIGR03790 family protein [Planctomycetaceae bacterium]